MVVEYDVEIEQQTPGVQFILWLFCPDDFLSFDKILAMRRNFDVPDSIIIRKMVQNLILKKLESDKIYNQLITYQIIPDNEDSRLMINSIIKLYIDLPNPIITRNMRDRVIDAKKYATDNNKRKSFLWSIIPKKSTPGKETFTAHSGYPLNDLVNGRPKLNWEICYYRNCFKHFTSANELKTHLEDLKVMKWGFHHYHEEAVKYLTREKVLALKMTKCPSMVCDKDKITFTPEELCDHFDRLGIQPFFTGKWCINNLDEPEPLCGYHDAQKIHITKECVVCLDAPSQIITNCNHAVMCIECICKLTRCPICNSTIENAYPL